MTSAVDFTAHYALSPDLAVVEREPGTVQIGVEAPRRLLLTRVPAGTGDILAALDGSRRAGDVISQHGGDPLQWRALLAELVRADFLVPAAAASGVPPHLVGARLALIHQYGAVTADRLLATRADAVVIVEGAGTVADHIADLMVRSGIGLVHQQTAHQLPGVAGTARARRSRPAQFTRHLDVSWQATGVVRVPHPAPQISPALVVLAGISPPGPARIAELMASVTAHLPVAATATRAVIGPLVLPGLSVCLNCLEQYRITADPGWPLIAATVRERGALPSTALLMQLAAATAVHQALQLIEAQARPDTVDATVEYLTGQCTAQRRSWPRHPDCGCRAFAG